MKISCGLQPCLEVVEQAQLAEELGYDRAWLYDSPAIYGDIWVALARVAERTERIGLGTAVLVPSLRSVIATASAMMLSAVSCAVRPPRSRPMGAYTRSRSSGVTSQRAIRSKRAAWVPRLPMAPM